MGTSNHGGDVLAIKKVRGKKGVFYLFMAIVFVTLFSLLFLSNYDYNQEEKTRMIASRLHSINDFTTDLQNDLDRAAFIAGFRAMIGLEEYLSDQGTFFDNQTQLEVAFKNVFITGELNGTPLDVMDNSSFNDYMNRVRNTADDVGITVNATVNDVNLTQQTPFTLLIEFDVNFYFSDLQKTAWWDYNLTFATEVAIYGIKDPLYTINTLGRVPNVILNYTLPTTGYVNDTNNDTTILKEFIEGNYYRTTPEAPSFLQRFTNDLSASPQGIESLVYLPALSDQGIVVNEDRSVVDHIYFSTNPSNSTDRCQIDGMDYTPDWFRLDQAHMDDYELDTLNSNPC